MLRCFNGMPEEVLQRTDLMQILLPSLCMDFLLYETCMYRAEVSSSCPIAVLACVNFCCVLCLGILQR
jgi:medium-chain acyl-[acyl-carrier-protein] hydrolase